MEGKNVPPQSGCFLLFIPSQIRFYFTEMWQKKIQYCLTLITVISGFFNFFSAASCKL